MSVVILNWNTLADTLDCAQSVPSDCLGKHCPTARVLRLANNLGYSGRNNVGLKLAMDHEAQYVRLLNNAATVAPDTITRLVAAMESDSRIGMATPRVFFTIAPPRSTGMAA